MEKNTPVCIVTGGSLGIGLAVCQTFSREGYHVVNLDLRDFEATPTRCEWKACDVSRVSDVTAAIDDIVAAYGRVDALVCNAGKHVSATIEETDEALLDAVFSLNVKGAYAAVKAVLPSMKSNNNGAIILMSSEQAIVAKHNSFAYNLSKAALVSIAKTTALDYAAFNIRANAVCPGTIETPLYHQAIDNYCKRSGENKADVHQEEESLQPLKRLGQPEEVASVVSFLASKDAAFITAETIQVGGGQALGI